MKKKMRILSIMLVFTMLMTGCSWSDFKAKFTGSSNGKDYKVQECITLGDYNGIEVDCTVSDDEVESELTTLQNEKATTKKIKNRKAKNGDTANIDFAGKVDGKAFDGGTGTDYNLVLGSNSFIDGFEEGVIGMKAGEKKDIKLKFPEDYGKEELNGKKVVFSVTMNHIEESVTPKITDAFIAKNTDYKTIAEFKEAKKTELVNSKKESAGTTALDNFTDTVEVKTYPESLMTQQRNDVDAQFKATLTMYGMDFDSYLTQSGMTEESYKEELEKVTEAQVKALLVVEAIAEKEKLEVTDDEFNKEMDSMVTQQNAESADKLRETFKEQYKMDLDSYLKNHLLQQKVEKKLAETAVIKEA